MRTHYDVLNLEKTCTAKDIKDSFIKLSKKFHPDLNKNSDAHKRFVEVNEAYSVLGNSTTRLRYDATLLAPKPTYHSTPYTTGADRYTYEQYAEMYKRHRSRHSDMGGLSHITTSKVKLFVFCCLVMVFGSSLQIVAETRRTRLRSQEFARALKEARERTCRIGKEQRLRELKEALLKK